MKPKKIDIAIVIILPIFAVALTLFYEISFLFSILLFFGAPAFYLALRNPGLLKKSIIFSLVFSIPVWISADTLAILNHAWAIPKSIFPFKVLGILTPENYIFTFLYVLFAVLFYEHFFDKGKRTDNVSAKIKYLVYIFAFGTLYVLLLFFFKPAWLSIPYVYLQGGIVLWVIPLVLFLFEYPAFVRRYIIVGVYFFFLLFAFEVVALKTGQWTFPGGDFIGSFHLWGVQFPMEELIIWILIATPSLLSYYEFFADDRRL